VDFDDLQSANNFRAIRTYGRSKLCNILFTRELARRLRGTEVTANCLHPNFVATRFGNESGGLLAVVTRLAKLFAISPATGAETIIYLASSPDVARVAGQYFYRSQPISPSPAVWTTKLPWFSWSGVRLWLGFGHDLNAADLEPQACPEHRMA
jgi:hypothetical protein